MMHDVDQVDGKRFFSLADNVRTQGHGLKFTSSRFKTDERKSFVE